MPSDSTSVSSVILADDLLDHVLQGHQPLEIAIFIDHHRQMLTALAKGDQLALQGRGIRDEPGALAKIGDFQPAEVGTVFLHRRQEVLGVQYADDALGLAAPDRESRIGAGHHLFQDLGQRLVGVDRLHGAAMGHHRAHLDLGKIENAAEHVAILFGHGALVGMQVDGAAHRLEGGGVEIGLSAHAAQAKSAVDHPLHQLGRR